MRVWTFQHPHAVGRMNELGYLSGDPEWIMPAYCARKYPNDDWSHMWRAYYWMRDEMSRRIPNYSDDWPVWVFLQDPTTDPDLMIYDSPWTELDGVNREIVLLLTCEVPEQRALPYSVSAWNAILGGMPVTGDEDEFERLMKHLDKRSIIEASWPRAFDRAWARSQDPEWADPDDFTEAVVDRIYIGEVVDIKGVVFPKVRTEGE